MIGGKEHSRKVIKKYTESVTTVCGLSMDVQENTMEKVSKNLLYQQPSVDCPWMGEVNTVGKLSKNIRIYGHNRGSRAGLAGPATAEPMF